MRGNHQGKPLNHSVIALVVSLVLLTSTAAGAVSFNYLATGDVFGGVTQTSAHCYVFNVGASIKILSGAIRDDTGAIVPVPASSDTCTGATLAQFKSCTIDANGPLTFQTYECTILTRGSTAGLRGVMDIRDSNMNVLINSNLR